MSFLPITLTNGEFSAPLSALDRGLAYGDGLFETCRVQAGGVPLWPWHRARLEAGARRLGIPLDLARLEEERQRLLSRAGDEEARLKLIVTRGEGGRAYRPPAHPEPSYCWQLRSSPPPDQTPAREGVVLYECRHRLGDNPALAGLKHLNRLEYVLARSEWEDDFPEGLLCDARGEVIEGTVSNVFVRLGDGWVTPPLNRNGVAGVMRRLLLEEIAPVLGWAVAQTPVSRAQLSGVREWFVCNSVFGIWPVVGLSGGESFEVGEQTRQWQWALNDWLGRAN